MQSYNQLIDEGLPGKTPKEKFDNLQLMKKVLMMVAFPRRGVDENLTIQDMADFIQTHFTIEDLQEN